LSVTDLPGRAARILLIRLEDRLGREQAQLLHHSIEMGECELALEESPMLAQDRIAISDQERATCWRWHAG